MHTPVIRQIWIQAALVLAAVTTPVWAQAPAPAPVVPTEVTTTEIPGVVKAGVKVRVLKHGLSGTEGPIALGDGSLVFTERPSNKIDRIDVQGAFSTYLENPNGINAMAIDASGRMFGVQWIKPRVAALAKDGSDSPVAEGFDGRPFGRPNDLVIDRSGGIYFTDPGQQAPARNAVFYIRPDRRVVKVTEDVELPNGIQLSPDERTLYVANTPGEYVFAFDRKDDGSTGGMRPFARLKGPAGPDGKGVRGGADGLAVDAAGRLYVATTAGVQVFSPGGEPLGVIPIGLPTGGPQNLAFAGPDKKTLFVVGRGAVFAVAMEAQGHTGRAK
jgi:gluconolactonase